MAHFRATIKGNRGEASRLGTPKSGIVATINGWHGGITVYASVNKDGDDEFTVLRTSGSNHGSYQYSKPIFNFTCGEEKKIYVSHPIEYSKDLYK